MKVKLLTVALVVALAGVLAGTASAKTHSNWPNGTLDSIASNIAGHPINVWCESSWGDWIHTGDSLSQDWSYLFGFTVMNQPWVYINPAKCETLHAFLANEWVGTYEASIAIQTLIHESVHQQGIADEGQAECKAITSFRDVAVNLFGVPVMIPDKKTVRYTKTVVRRIKGQRVVIKVPSTKVVTVQVPDPYLASLVNDANRWHRSMPAVYQTVC